MGRVPALRAESIFYWIRQEERKRRDAIAKLEYKTMYFYTEAMKSKQAEDINLPRLPINDNSETKVDGENDKNDFLSQVKSLDVLFW